MVASLTADQVAAIRTWVPWTPPVDDDLETTHQRLGASWRHVAVEHLRARLATMLGQPSQFAIPGEYSQSTADTIKGLQDSIADLLAEIALDPTGTSLVTGGLVAGKIVRADLNR